MLNYHEHQQAVHAQYVANLATVQAQFPNACVFADYTDEAAWSEVRADVDEDGFATGELLGVGLTHDEAMANAAENVRDEYGKVSEHRGEFESPSGQAVHSLL